jgi:sugar lactone lactonase YvrE
MVPGTYQLALWLPDPAADLQDNSAYSIRLANQNVWDGANGYNLLDSTIAIVSPAQGGASTGQSTYGTPYGFFTFGGQPGATKNTGQFCNPSAIAVDASGNVFVADSGNDTIRKVSSNGLVSTIAGQAGIAGSIDGAGLTALFNEPSGIAVAENGTIYVADSGNNTIREITPLGVVSTLAGIAGQVGSSDGSGPGAMFHFPAGIAVDGLGNVYVADECNQLIRKVTPSGAVTTIAGKVGTQYIADGQGSAAAFFSPMGVAVDNSGNIYVADAANGAIRVINPAGFVSTLAGSTAVNAYAPTYLATGADGTGSAAQFFFPSSVSLDSSGNIYVADTYEDTIRKVTPSGFVSTVAGATLQVGDTDGPGSAARFSQPCAVASDSSGNVYVADAGNNTIRKIVTTGNVTTLAGTSGYVGSSDGLGGAAEFVSPSGITTDASGNSYVADSADDTVGEISSAGVVSTLAGTSGVMGDADGAGTSAEFFYPTGIAADSNGNIYVADTGNSTIRRINAGVVTTFAGVAGHAGALDGGPGVALFNQPSALAVDLLGNVYVADTHNDTIREISPEGAVTTLAGSPGETGSSDGVGTAALFKQPAGITVDEGENVYVADTGNNTIRTITAGGTVTTLAGAPGVNGCLDGLGTAALFNSPSGVAVDKNGNLFVADTLNNAIRIIALGGAVTTLAGNPNLPPGSADAAGANALFCSPTGIAVDSTGDVLVADFGNRTIRKGGVATGPMITVQPSPKTAVAGGTASFTVSANGNPGPTYQWQLSTNGGKTFTSLTDGNGVSGSATAVLNLSPVVAGQSGNLYECVITNSVSSVTTNPAGLIVDTPPSITTNPTSQTVNAGSGVVLSVAVSSSLPPTYQWYYNGNPIGGATGSTLSLSSVSAADAGTYAVNVTTSAGTIYSSAATLAVNASASSSVIVTQPASQMINAGSTIVFTVITGGGANQTSLREDVASATSYQWQFNGVNLTDGNGITGSTGPQLLIQGTTAANDGDYACVVTTGGTSVTSNTAGLLVETVSSPGSVSSISSRAFVGTGDNILIGGFYIVGSTSATVLVQAIGPALAAAPYNVTGTLQKPALSIHQTQNGKDVVLYSNVGWGSSPILLAAAAAAYAQPVLTPNAADSEVLLTLPPGGYTAEVSGADEGTGVALCAIYQLP